MNILNNTWVHQIWIQRDYHPRLPIIFKVHSTVQHSVVGASRNANIGNRIWFWILILKILSSDNSYNNNDSNITLYLMAPFIALKVTLHHIRSIKKHAIVINKKHNDNQKSNVTDAARESMLFWCMVYHMRCSSQGCTLAVSVTRYQGLARQFYSVMKFTRDSSIS